MLYIYQDDHYVYSV